MSASFRAPLIFGLHAEPTMRFNLFLAVLPFVLLITVYFIASDAHINGSSLFNLEANPDYKLLPSLGKMVEAVKYVAWEADKRTGKRLLWLDTAASLKRLGIGITAAALVGLWIGLHMGLFPGLRALGLAFITVVSIIPPLAVLPILFITINSLGMSDEFAKVALIFIGTCWLISRDIYLAVIKIPKEQITNALTLGASPFKVVYCLVLPQIIPRLLNTVRLCLGSAWLFLIAAEAISATEGLGYRIFLVRRYLAMDTIIPYVIWITLIGFSLDWLLRKFVVWRYSWYAQPQD